MQGYLIGNGVTDPEFDGNALAPFARGKALISHALFGDLMRACNGSFWDAQGGEQLFCLAFLVTSTLCDTQHLQSGTACGALVDELNAAVADLNLYDILEPCYHGAHALQRNGRREWPLGGAVAQGAAVRNWAHLGLGEHPPCLDHRELTVWLDDAAVREALHAAPLAVTGAFQVRGMLVSSTACSRALTQELRLQECTSRITYTHDLGSMLPLHSAHISRGLRVLIYNGDHDM
jgi:serine carboxypeptidase-like clade 1